MVSCWAIGKSRSHFFVFVPIRTGSTSVEFQEPSACPDDVSGPWCKGRAHGEYVPKGNGEQSGGVCLSSRLHLRLLLSPVSCRPSGTRREQATARPDCLSTRSAASPRLRLASSAPKKTPNRVHGSRTHANGRPIVSVQVSPPLLFSSSIQTLSLTLRQRR